MSPTDASHVDEERTGGGFSPLPRPPFQLRSLPLRTRCEVTRRHPYYQMYWNRARDTHRNVPPSFPGELLLRQAAVTLLGLIGIGGEPPDPALAYDEIGTDGLKAAWNSGAVHPVSLKGMASLLLACLPKATLGQLGDLFSAAAREEVEGGPPPRMESLLGLTTLNADGLDGFPDEPFVSINPAASGRQVTDAVAELLRDWKSERDISETRDRSEKYDEYLRTWDLREGWSPESGYDRTRERLLREVAAETRESPGTVGNRYRRAFELITGHPYSPETWFRVMGLLKLVDMAGKEIGRASRSRPLKSRSQRDVPESMLQQDAGTERGVVTGAAGTNDDGSVIEIVHDIRTLVEAGRSDDEIVEELGLAPRMRDVVAYLRNRETWP